MLFSWSIQNIVNVLAAFWFTTTLSLPSVDEATEEQPSYCFEPPGNGCRATHPRYYYNDTLGECEFFYYGGCAGGRNIFRKREECERACRRDEETMRAVNNNMKCSFDINYGNECYADDDDLSLDIELCGNLPFNFFNSRETCEANGCCWHPNFMICYQRTEPPQPVTCTITYATDTMFHGKIVVTSHTQYNYLNNNWVGILSLDRSANGEFCIIKDKFSEGQATLKRDSNYRKRDKFFITNSKTSTSSVFEGIGNSKTIHFVGSFNSSQQYDEKLLKRKCSDYSIP